MKRLRIPAVCCICLFTLGTSLPAQNIADSADDWSSGGIQGENNWFNGWYNLTEDQDFGDGEYQADDFNEFENDGSNQVEGVAGFYYPRDAQSPENHWTGSIWDLNAAAQPWTYIGSEGTHPNGINYLEEHWTVHRWISDREQAGAGLRWHMRKTNLNGSGVTGKLFITKAADGETIELDSVGLEGNDGTGVQDRAPR